MDVTTYYIYESNPLVALFCSIVKISYTSVKDDCGNYCDKLKDNDHGSSRGHLPFHVALSFMPFSL